MKGFTRRFSQIMGCNRYAAVGALAVAMLLTSHRAEASAIRHEDLSRADATTFKEWSRYLLAGPSVWKDVIHPPVTPAVRSAIWESVRTDPGGADPMVKFLLWKQSLDPTRFAHYHPKLAPALNKIIRESHSSPQQLIPPSSTSPSGTPTTGETPTSPSIPAEQGLNPPPLPEPSTLLVALGMAGWGIWRIRRGKLNP